MNNTIPARNLAKAVSNYHWMADLHQKRVWDPTDQPETEDEDAFDDDQIYEPGSEPPAISPEELELETHHELIRIYRDSLAHPISDSQHQRVRSIVKPWQESKR